MVPKISTILYAADFSPNAPQVFRYAISLARSYGAKIVIVHAVEPLGATAKSLLETMLSPSEAKNIREEGKKRVFADIEKRLLHFCDEEVCLVPLREGEVSGVSIREGRPDQVIVEEAARIGADVIVLGAHCREKADAAHLGSVAQRVLTHAAMPVLAVRTKGAKAG